MLLPPGIQILERGWLSANNVVFRTGVRAVVDTGYWTHQEQTLQLIKDALCGAELDVVVNTHLHSDHCGGNLALKKHYPVAKLFIPKGLSKHVSEWDAEALTYGPTGQHCPPFMFDDVLHAGAELQLGDMAWEVHSAPGHDPHSVILFQRAHRILISADALWKNGFGVVFPELEGERAFAEVEMTLNLIEELAPRVVIPGHGAVFTDVTSALERARRRLLGFVNDPRKHALHAAKVLVKFKLLELQEMTEESLNQWVGATQYFQLIHQRHFSSDSLASWVRQLVDDLVRSDAAIRSGPRILNS